MPPPTHVHMHSHTSTTPLHVHTHPHTSTCLHACPPAPTLLHPRPHMSTCLHTRAWPSGPFSAELASSRASRGRDGASVPAAAAGFARELVPAGTARALESRGRWFSVDTALPSRPFVGGRTAGRTGTRPRRGGASGAPAAHAAPRPRGVEKQAGRVPLGEDAPDARPGPAWTEDGGACAVYLLSLTQGHCSRRFIYFSFSFERACGRWGGGDTEREAST